MQRLLLTLALGGSLCLPVRSQSGWVIGEEVEGAESFEQVYRASNGDLIVLWDTEDGDVFMRLSPAGVPLWAKRYTADPNGAAPFLHACTTFADGSIAAIIGTGDVPSPLPGTSGHCFVLVRTDASGGVLWTKKITFSTVPFGTDYRLFPLSSGGLAVTFRGSSNMIYRTTLDAAGQLISANLISFSLGSFMHTQFVVNANDEMTLLVPEDILGGGDHLVRWNSNGDLAWAKTVQLTNGNWSSFSNAVLVATDDGSAYAYGVQVLGGSMEHRYPYMVKFDADGEVQWYKLYGSGEGQFHGNEPGSEGSDGALVFGVDNADVFTPEGEHLAAFNINIEDPPGTPDSITWAQRTERLAGDTLLMSGYRWREDPLFGYWWTTNFLALGSVSDVTGCLWQRSDDPLFATDTIVPAAYVSVTDHVPGSVTQPTAMDTLANGISFPLPATQPLCAFAIGVPEEPGRATAAQLFPDPAPQGTPVELLAAANTRFTILDAHGRTQSTMRATADGRATIDTSNLPAGLYFVNLTDGVGARIGTLKLVVL